MVPMQCKIEDAYAGALNFLQDCTDVANVASRAEMLGYGDTIGELAARLKAAGLCLVWAGSEVLLRSLHEMKAGVEAHDHRLRADGRCAQSSDHIAEDGEPAVRQGRAGRLTELCQQKSGSTLPEMRSFPSLETGGSSKIS